MDRIRFEVEWARLALKRLVRESIPRAIAWALPRSIVYHAAVRAWVFSLSGKHASETVGEVRTFETVERWRTQDH